MQLYFCQPPSCYSGQALSKARGPVLPVLVQSLLDSLIAIMARVST
ncbi:hypothetical protein VFPPC_18382 [Pochonia chlamydosporia 170]|uniref:Uncharacterized protein n=1 Tax=Pochonia chlamydosporia 170 TaxID=1380566 RepID=A0A219ANZ3_METCM|nr:hypothetical protein VFPPC_18382 [Pochonia chlamydosporia 170]OWT42441.1 hypothetical protein VFPPC_18382 [Pochonia chlamydosporia 170]